MKFEPRHFKDLFFADQSCPTDAANIANGWLNRYLETCPVVYCTQLDSGEERYWTSSEKRHQIDTHRAVLFNLQPLVCEHKNVLPIREPNFDLATEGVCSDCGKKLIKRVIWEERE